LGKIGKKLKIMEIKKRKRKRDIRNNPGRR